MSITHSIDHFGESTSFLLEISGHTHSLLSVGAPNDSTNTALGGLVRIYKKDAGSSTFGASPIQTISPPSGNYKWFGRSCSLEGGDGTSTTGILSVGAIETTGSNVSKGVVFIYTMDMSGGSFGTTPIQKLTA